MEKYYRPYSQAQKDPNFRFFLTNKKKNSMQINAEYQ